MKNKRLEFFDYDSGFCRMLYRYKSESGKYFYYCFQEDFTNIVEFYKCSNDDEYFEPEYSTRFKETIEIEIPKTYDERFNNLVIDFVKNKGSEYRMVLESEVLKCN